ncbi:MAG: multiprotein-bridging factor 1 family protein [Candidatus Paceibacteria bacterium]
MEPKGIKQQLLEEDDDFRESYFKKDFVFELGQILIEARTRRGLTQEELAQKIGSKQPAIARIENGRSLPTLNTLKRIARALNTHLIPPLFGFMKDYYSPVYDFFDGNNEFNKKEETDNNYNNLKNGNQEALGGIELKTKNSDVDTKQTYLLSSNNNQYA